MEKRIIKFENIHILLWLLKDLSWLMGFRFLGVVVMIPTIIIAVLIVYSAKKSKPELLPNLAVLFWIIANSFWMLVEFFAIEDGIRFYAVIPFTLGMVVICYYFVLLLKKDYPTH